MTDIIYNDFPRETILEYEICLATDCSIKLLIRCTHSGQMMAYFQKWVSTGLSCQIPFQINLAIHKQRHRQTQWETAEHNWTAAVVQDICKKITWEHKQSQTKHSSFSSIAIFMAILSSLPAQTAAFSPGSLKLVMSLNAELKAPWHVYKTPFFQLKD